MTGVIMHTAEAFDQNGHPRKGPKICTETVGPRPLAKLPVQTLELLITESGPASSPAGATQSLDAVSLPLSVPAAYALTAHPESPRDLRHRQLSSSEHAGCLFTPLSQSSKIPSRAKYGWHIRIIRAMGNVVTLLCEVQ